MAPDNHEGRSLRCLDVRWLEHTAQGGGRDDLHAEVALQVLGIDDDFFVETLSAVEF